MRARHRPPLRHADRGYSSMKWVAWVLLACIASGCSNETRTPQEHQAAMEDMWPRPDGLPETAFLRAGLDGGEWIDCDSGTTRPTCRFYLIRSGVLDREQVFRLCLLVSDPQNTITYRRLDQSLGLQESVIRFVPVGPATVYTRTEDGPVVDDALTAKAAREFIEENPGECETPLVIDRASVSHADRGYS